MHSSSAWVKSVPAGARVSGLWHQTRCHQHCVVFFLLLRKAWVISATFPSLWFASLLHSTLGFSFLRQRESPSWRSRRNSRSRTSELPHVQGSTEALKRSNPPPCSRRKEDGIWGKLSCGYLVLQRHKREVGLGTRQCSGVHLGKIYLK